jgi:hypothetical protein
MRREGKTETSLCEQWKHGEVDERIDSIQDAPREWGTSTARLAFGRPDRVRIPDLGLRLWIPRP